MFKVLSAVICLMLMMLLFACGKDASEMATTEQNVTTNSYTTVTNDKEDESTATEHKNVVVDASYFDDAAFVGDSVSLKLSYYAMSTKKLGDAQFFTAGALGVSNALWEISDESVHPSYQGTKMLVEDCIASSGAKKVYIMLGMNDLSVYGIEGTLENYKELASRIVAKSPDAHIIVQSMTPITDTSSVYGEGLNNDVIREYNENLAQFAKDNGYSFLDVASVMYDAEGTHLNREYCSDPDDMGMHFTEEGCDAWIEYLYTHTS